MKKIIIFVVLLFMVGFVNAEWVQMENFETGSTTSPGYPDGWNYEYIGSGAGSVMCKSTGYAYEGTYTHIQSNGYSTQSWSATVTMSIYRDFDFTEVTNISINMFELMRYSGTTTMHYNISVGTETLYYKGNVNSDYDGIIYFDVSDITGTQTLKILSYFQTSGSSTATRYNRHYVDNLSFYYTPSSPKIGSTWLDSDIKSLSFIDYLYTEKHLPIAEIYYGVDEPAPPSGEWDDTSSPYRIPITISTTETVSDYEYQTRLSLTTSNVPTSFSFADDLDSIRFYTGGNKINYFVEESDSSSATVWVNHSISTGDNVVYMYYGNSGYISESDAEDVLYGYDNFDTAPTFSYYADSGYPTSRAIVPWFREAKKPFRVNFSMMFDYRRGLTTAGTYGGSTGWGIGPNDATRWARDSGTAQMFWQYYVPLDTGNTLHLNAYWNDEAVGGVQFNDGYRYTPSTQNIEEVYIIVNPDGNYYWEVDGYVMINAPLPVSDPISYEAFLGFNYRYDRVFAHNSALSRMDLYAQNTDRYSEQYIYDYIVYRHLDTEPSITYGSEETYS